MTHFRKRLGEQVLREINEIIAVEAAKSTPDSDRDDEPKSGRKSKGKRTTKRHSTSEEDPNQGVLLLDATCAPADVAYPTDLNLLNEAREKLEEIIDTLHAHRLVVPANHGLIGIKPERSTWPWPNNVVQTAR
ncbi:hypothetical protein BBOR36S_01650 [Brevibacillus borstelensis]